MSILANLRRLYVVTHHKKGFEARRLFSRLEECQSCAYADYRFLSDAKRLFAEGKPVGSRLLFRITEEGGISVHSLHLYTQEKETIEVLYGWVDKPGYRDVANQQLSLDAGLQPVYERFNWKERYDEVSRFTLENSLYHYNLVSDPVAYSFALAAVNSSSTRSVGIILYRFIQGEEDFSEFWIHVASDGTFGVIKNGSYEEELETVPFPAFADAYEYTRESIKKTRLKTLFQRKEG